MNKTNDEKEVQVNSWREFYPKEFICADDLERMDGKAGYRSFALRIAKVVLKEVQQSSNLGGGKKPKPVCFFWKTKNELTKGLILNVTMCKQIEEITGSANPRDWIGENVELYVEIGVRCPKSDENPEGRADVVRLRKPKEANKANLSEFSSADYTMTPKSEKTLSGFESDEPRADSIDYSDHVSENRSLRESFEDDFPY